MLGFLWARKVKVEIEKQKLDLQPECKPPDPSRRERLHDLDLRAAYNLLSYIWTASANEEELILPNFAFYNAWGRPIHEINRTIVSSWLENIERVKKDRMEKKELTVKVEEILASEYGIIKPKKKASAANTAKSS